MSQTTEYKKQLTDRYWGYQERYFPDFQALFDQSKTNHNGPPVFTKDHADCNVLTNPDATQEKRNSLLHILPKGERHVWFRSMNSSQALAQSVLGNLAIHNQLHVLADLTDERGLPIFGKADPASKNFSMEHKGRHLAEQNSTSLDGFISGCYQVAIECKFTEAEVGACSRPSLPTSASNYATHKCNKSYSNQLAWKGRCALTEIGVAYWKYVPKLFNWQNDNDIPICPLHKNYQLVRNILVVCVRKDGTVSSEYGHVTVIYDERNPAFLAGGHVLRAFDETRNALLDPSVLRKYSWQSIVQQMKKNRDLLWLTEQLELKYGLK